MVRTTHYHIIENTPGYMPDSEPADFTNRGIAQSYMAQLARELREDGYKVSGNRRIGYYAERDSRDLGRSIVMHICHEQFCYSGD
jgi:hypothetical protein